MDQISNRKEIFEKINNNWEVKSRYMKKERKTRVFAKNYKHIANL